MSDFDPKELLGRAEDEHLEFKDADALRRPFNIAREVVGFLNGDGGSVWIGIRESGGRAVELQTIPNSEAARRSLLDSLIDLVEPRFDPKEVSIKCVGSLLKVVVAGKGRTPPYAARQGGRHFLIRVADRLREMSREELAKDFGAHSEDIESSKETLAKTRDELRAAQRGEALQREQLWLRLAPIESLKIDFDELPTQERFSKWLTDPTATGNRRSGWGFATDLRRPRFVGNLVKQGNDDDYMRMAISERGVVSFAVDVHALSRLESPTPRFEPYALLEYPVSVFRLMAQILRTYATEKVGLQIVAGFVIKGIRGWILMPGSPRAPVHSWKKPKSYDHDVLAIDPDGLEFDASGMMESPDRRAFKLIRRVYGEFGFEPEDIPSEFDQKQGRLLLE
jgi:hypothetical protein